MTQTKDALLDMVLECQKACNNCFYACLKEDDVKMMADCIRLDRECADLCGLVVDFAQRESDRLPEILELCAKGIILIAGTTLLILVFYITLSKLMELFMPDGWMFYEVYSKWSFIFVTACLVELAHIGLSESHRKSINHKIVWASALTLVLSIYIFASSTIIVSEANIIVRSPFNPVGKVYYYQNIEQVKAYFTDNSFMNNLLMKNGGTFIYEIKLDDKVYEFQTPTINTESKYAEAETYAELEDFDTQLVALNIPKETSTDHAELNQLDPIYKNRFLRILSNP